MEYIIAYLLVTYTVAVTLAVLTLRLKLVRRLVVRLLVVIVLLAAPLAPYGLVHLQTLVFKNALLKAARAEHMVFDNSSVVRDTKVLRIRPRSALLYVVVSDGVPREYSGFTVELVRSKEGWRTCGKWDVIWSDSGSAHGNVFPPYQESY